MLHICVTSYDIAYDVITNDNIVSIYLIIYDL